MQLDKIPVLLLTGYLGSGKTTLLNRILSNKKGIRFAVIVNDIGEVNIDAELIQKGGVVAQQDDNLIALQNGCICCSLKMDLVQQLRDLCAAKEQSSHNTTNLRNAFDYIVIEASGICEPAPIAQTICSYPSMVPTSSAPIPYIDSIVTIVDALRLRDEFTAGDDLQRNDFSNDNLASLVIQQIEFCNIILLNKASMVSQAERSHIKNIIRAIQPKAEIVECDYCDVSFSKLLDTDNFDFDEVATSATWIQKVESDVEEDHHHRHEHCNHGHHHDSNHNTEHAHHHEHDEHCHCQHCQDHHHNHGDEYGIYTFVYYRRQPMSLNLFDEFVARHWDKGIIRCKGMCYFEEEYDMCYLFEQAGKQFDLKQAGAFYATMPEEELMQMMAQDPMLQRDWDEKYGDRMQKLVFIGQNMDKDAICQALDNCIITK